MKSGYPQWLITLIGLLITVIGLAGALLELASEPQKLRVFSLIGYVVFAVGVIWFAFSSGETSQTWRWIGLAVLYLSTIPFFVWVGTWVGTSRNTRLVAQREFNHLVTYHGFEGTDDGWSKLDITIVDQNGASIAALSDGSRFPGSIDSEITSEHALEGSNSLRVTTSVTEQGEYKGYLYRQGSISGYGIAIYVMVPEVPDACSMEYVQLCIPSRGWVCSKATDLVAGEWTPIVIDLSQSYGGEELYNQKLTELAVQWRFSTKSGTSFDLFFDAAEVFHSGPAD